MERACPCAESLGFRVRGSGFRVRGSGFRVQGSGFRLKVWDVGFRVWGLGIGVEGELSISVQASLLLLHYSHSWTRGVIRE